MSSGNKRQFAHYRKTELGQTLYQTLEELITDGQFPESLALQAFAHFDRRLSEWFEKVTASAKIDASQPPAKLQVYRSCDNVWTFFLDSRTLQLSSQTGEDLSTAFQSWLVVDGAQVWARKQVRDHTRPALTKTKWSPAWVRSVRHNAGVPLTGVTANDLAVNVVFEDECTKDCPLNPILFDWTSAPAKPVTNSSSASASHSAQPESTEAETNDSATNGQAQSSSSSSSNAQPQSDSNPQIDCWTRISGGGSGGLPHLELVQKGSDSSSSSSSSNGSGGGSGGGVSMLRCWAEIGGFQEYCGIERTFGHDRIQPNSHYTLSFQGMAGGSNRSPCTVWVKGQNTSGQSVDIVWHPEHYQFTAERKTRITIDFVTPGDCQAITIGAILTEPQDQQPKKDQGPKKDGVLELFLTAVKLERTSPYSSTGQLSRECLVKCIECKCPIRQMKKRDLRPTAFPPVVKIVACDGREPKKKRGRRR